MKFDGAIVTEQGITFGIVVVQPHVLQNSITANRLIGTYQGILNVAPVVLMAQDGQGRPTYYGRKDIANFLAHIDMSRIPWQTYTVT